MRRSLREWRGRAQSAIGWGNYSRSAGKIPPAPAASYVEVFLHLGHDLWFGEFVGGLDLDNGLRRRHGSTEPFLEFQLRLARPEDQDCLRCPQVIDNLVVVAVEAFSVPFLVFLLTPAILLAAEVRMCGDVRCERPCRDATL